MDAASLACIMAGGIVARHEARRARRSLHGRAPLGPGPSLTGGHRLLTLEAAQKEFEPTGVYVNTASIGLPPRRAVEALHESIEVWRTGRAEAAAYDDLVDRARRRFAGMVGVTPDRVAIGNQVSTFSGLVAAAPARRRSRARRRGGLHLGAVPLPGPRRSRGAGRGVPLDRLVAAIRPGVTWWRSARCSPRTAASCPGASTASPPLPGPRLPHLRRRHTGRWLAPVRRRPLRFRLVRRVQVALLAARDGLRRGAARAPGDASAVERRLVRGRRHLGLDLRAAAAAGQGRPSARHLAGVARVGGHRARARPAGRGGDRGDPPARPRPRERAPRAARPARGRLGHRHRRRHRRPRPPTAADIKASTRAGAVRLSFHLHNTESDVDAVAHALTA